MLRYSEEGARRPVGVHAEGELHRPARVLEDADAAAPRLRARAQEFGREHVPERVRAQSSVGRHLLDMRSRL